MVCWVRKAAARPVDGTSIGGNCQTRPLTHRYSGWPLFYAVRFGLGQPVGPGPALGGSLAAALPM